MLPPTLATAAAIVAFFASPAVVLGQGGFFQSCDTNWSFDNNLLLVQCPRDDGVHVNSVQDMNLCMGNNNGALVAQDGGGFYGSCFACGQDHFAGQPDTSVVACSCTTSDGTTVIPTIDMNTFLTNVNGLVDCFGHLSSPS